MAYADDLCILRMLLCGMQKLLNICEIYRSDIMHYIKKGLTMLFKPKKLKTPLLYLCNKQLDYVEKIVDI